MQYSFLTYNPSAKQDLIDINTLLRQLSAHSRVVTANYLESLLQASYVIVARDDNSRIVGMATLVPFVAPTRKAGLVEDIVVKEDYRGRGIGKELMQRVIDKARSLDLQRLELTSRSSRVFANMLYKSLGFAIRETNAYELRL